MKKEVVEHDTQLRRYLLDELTADEQQSIEERLLVDNDYLEQMLIVEEDLIDDFTTGNLSPQQQSTYRKLFLASPEGKKKLQISQVLKKHLNHFPSEIAPQMNLWERIRTALTQTISMPALKFATAATLILGLSAFSWWAFFQSDLRTGINALKSAYGEQRPLEARITGLPYASFSRSTSPHSQTSATKLKVADKAFQELMKEKQTPTSLHGLGKYSLTQKKFDEAVNYLEEASKSAPDNAAIHTDLAVAFLERGKLSQINSQTEKAQADFDNCLKHLKMALTQNPMSPEASFNLALYYQSIQAWKDAEENWQTFLNLEPNSKWSEEARHYLSIAVEAQKK